MVVEACAAGGVQVPVFTHGLVDEFALVGPPSHLYRYYGLEQTGIESVGRRALERASAGSPGGERLWHEADRQRVLAG